MRKFTLIIFLLTLFCSALLGQSERLNEGFEVYNASTKLPEGWAVVTQEGTRPFAVVKSSNFGTPQSRTGKCYVSSTSNPPRYDDPKVRRDNWLISPKLKYAAGASFKLWAKSKDAPGSLAVPQEDPSSRFAIYLSKTGAEPTDFALQLLEVIQVPNAYTEYSVDLSNPDFGLTAGDEIFIAIRVVDEVDLSTDPNTNRILYIDDVEYGAPLTTPVVELNTTTWSAETMVGEMASSGNVFNLKNVGGGVLTVTSVTDLSGTPFATTLVKDAVSLSQDQSYPFAFSYSSNSPLSTTKDFVIETNAGSVTVSLSGTTVPLPNPLSAIDEDFDSGLPDNWLVIDGNNDKNKWKIKSGAPVLELNGTVQNDWLVLPRIKVSEGMKLSFDYKCSLADKGIINIKASKQGRVIESFNITLAENIVVPHSPVEFLSKQIDLVGSSLVDGDEVFIAIQCVSEPVGGVLPGKLTLDNVKVGALSGEANIIKCTVANQLTSVVNNDKGTVDVTVPSTMGLLAVEPVFEISANASISPSGVQDFSKGAVTYTVTAAGGNRREWQVSVAHPAVLSDAALITAFRIDGVSATAIINSEASSVSLTVPASVDLTKVKPVVEVSEGASVHPLSGAEQDFSQGDVVYTVTAAAGNTRPWQVSVVHEEVAVEGLAEGFEGGALPTNWRMADADKNGKAWFVIKYMPFEGEYIIKTKRNTTRNNDWLITPRVKVRANDVLSFMYRSSAVNYKESFNVKVSKKGVNVDTDFTLTLAEVVDASAELGFAKFEYKLCDNANIAPGDEVYIAIQVVSEDKAELHIDNFSVAPPPTNPKLAVQGDHWRAVTEVNKKSTSPEVFAITNTLAGVLTVSSIELPQGFSTSFNPSAVSLAKDEVYRFTVSFEPTVAGDYTGSMVVKTNGGDASINLTGYAYGGGLYHEGFEDEAAINKWEVMDADGDGLAWFPYQNNEYAPDLAHSGLGCAVSESAKLSGGAATPDNWLISPKVVVGESSSLLFWVGAVSDLSFKEHYSVLLSTKGKNLADFDVVLIDNEELTSHTWGKRSVDLSAYANRPVYVAFVHHKVSDQSQIILDDMIMPAVYIPTSPDLTVMLKQMDYTISPLSQAVYTFDAKVKNQGAALDKEVNLTFTVQGTDYSHCVAIPLPLAAESDVVLTATKPFTATAKGEFTVRVEAALENDENPADNAITTTFAVSDSVLARDRGVYSNFVGLGTSNAGIVGQKFALVVKDTLTSISFYRVAAEAELTVSASVFGFAQSPTQELVRSADVVVPAGFEGWVTIPLANPLVLEPGSYFIGLNESAEGNLGLAVDQSIFHAQSCFIQFMGQWIAAEELETAMQMVPLIRANFGSKAIVDSDSYDRVSVGIYPNPANDWVVIEGMAGAVVSVYNLGGLACMSFKVDSDSERVNISQLTPGVYVIRFNKQGVSRSVRLVVAN